MRKASHWRYNMPLVFSPNGPDDVPPNNLAYDSLRPNYDVLSMAYPKPH
jgi:hypothetical protein